ncbi:Gp138 family membrane-puncturing spike protein [Halobacillus sp. SY10]|uniref:Gp138 family membrane-puncturing spike protein n=1 Tax=Halobacillus sp. SY10 TaxID=3381356 RepID=UPI00387A6D10
MNDTSFFSEFKRDILLSINTCLPCRVISYDKMNREAKLQPLFKTKEKNRSPKSLPVIEGVPVLFQQYEVNGSIETYHPVLYQGQVVQVAVNQRAIDDVLNGQSSYPDVSKLFRLRDAVVIGVIT